MKLKHVNTNLRRLVAISLIWVSMCLLAGSCGFFRSPDRERCHKIISREQITNILADIYLMEGYLSDRLTIQPNLIDSIDYFYAGIFHKHAVSIVDFRQALDCYLLFEAEMEQIHEEILNRLSLKMSEAEANLQRYIRQQEELLHSDSLATDSIAINGLSAEWPLGDWYPREKPPLVFIKNSPGRKIDDQGRR